MVEKAIVQTVVDSAHRLVSCVIRVDASRQRVRLFRRCMSCAIPCGQSATEASGYSASAGQSSRAVSPVTAWMVPEGATFTGAARCLSSLLKSHSLKLPPFATTDAFGDRSLVRTKPDVIAVLSSTRLPGFTGRDLLTTTGSSATSHHMSHFLSCLLKPPYPLLTLRLWGS